MNIKSIFQKNEINEEFIETFYKELEEVNCLSFRRNFFKKLEQIRLVSVMYYQNRLQVNATLMNGIDNIKYLSKYRKFIKNNNFTDTKKTKYVIEGFPRTSK